MLRGYVSSDSDDMDDLDAFYCEPPVKLKQEPRSLPQAKNEKLREKLNSAMKEMEKIDLFLEAADNGDLSTIEELITLGVSVDCSKENGWTPLLKACGSGNFEIVRFLLEHGSNPNLQIELLTPLMVCCNHSLTPESSKLNCVRLLLQHGADVNAKDKYRTTALMYASESDYRDIVAELLAVPGIDINMQDKEGLTALFYAVHSNNQVVAEKLVAAGIDLTLKDRYNRTAVNLALENGLDEMAKLLGYVEEAHMVIQEKESDLNYRFLQQLPDSLGRGGFQSDVKHILDSLELRNVKDITFPEFLNATQERLYEIGVKIKPKQHIILKLIHLYHLRPWKKLSIHTIKKEKPFCTEDAVAILGDLTKHLTIANASLQYLDSRLSSRMTKECKGTNPGKDLIVTLTEIQKTSEKITVILPKILKHINEMAPEMLDDYIFPKKEKKNCKFWKWMWYGWGIVGVGILLNKYLVS